MASIANAKHLFLMVKEQSEQSNVTSMLKNIFVIMLQNWIGLLPEMFDNFEEVLQDAALVKWETGMQNLAPAHQTMECFNQAVEECLLEQVAPLAKNHMIKSVKEFRRPIHAEP